MQKFQKGVNGLHDQQYKFDGEKLRYDLIPVKVLEELAKVLTYGANKYSANSWQNVEPFDDRYYAAAMRHLMEWRKGNQVDTESGLEHLSHALCCIAFLVTGNESKG